MFFFSCTTPDEQGFFLYLLFFKRSHCFEILAYFCFKYWVIKKNLYLHCSEKKYFQYLRIDVVGVLLFWKTKAPAVSLLKHTRREGRQASVPGGLGWGLSIAK